MAFFLSLGLIPPPVWLLSQAVSQRHTHAGRGLPVWGRKMEEEGGTHVLDDKEAAGLDGLLVLLCVGYGKHARNVLAIQSSRS